jgi:hypothetical protein
MMDYSIAAITTEYFGIKNSHEVPTSYGPYTMGLWSRATADVQWNPGDA